VLGTGLSEYTFELPGAMTEPTELAIEVPGYQRWSLILRYKLANTRKWDIPIWPKPLPVVLVAPEET